MEGLDIHSLMDDKAPRPGLAIFTSSFCCMIAVSRARELSDSNSRLRIPSSLTVLLKYLSNLKEDFPL
jgi:hypothetical protein